MDIDVITLFPGMFDAITEYGVTSRAIERDLLALRLWNPREYTEDRHRTVDDRPYGGGPGMVMKTEPLERALDDICKQHGSQRPVVYLSPQGKKLDHEVVAGLANRKGMILLAGRYEGVDERFIATHVDMELSVGDYVLTGGELPAMVLVDAVARQLEGVLGNDLSAQADSFAEGLLDCPHYTRPETYKGQTVPDVLLSGDHAAIARWRMKQSLGRTWLRRPDLLDKADLDREQQMLLNEFKREHEGIQENEA
jgi:tRNA (guanine37-N1)-methyltransferase